MRYIRSMKILLLVGFLLSSFSGYAQVNSAVELSQTPQAGAISALDAQNGFRTYVLGAPIRDYPQLKRKSKDIYESPQELLVLDNVQLTSLLFTSYNGRLASVAYGTLGVNNIDALVSSFMAKYGPSTSTNAVGQTWVGTKATLYVVRVGGGDLEIGYVTIKSNELAAAERAAQK